MLDIDVDKNTELSKKITLEMAEINWRTGCFCGQRGATIVYATHIFDGLETWATHLAYIQDGELRKSEKLSEVDELKHCANLLSVVENWLRAETKLEKKKKKKNPILPPSNTQKNVSPFGSSPFSSSRHMAYYR